MHKIKKINKLESKKGVCLKLLYFFKILENIF